MITIEEAKEFIQECVNYVGVEFDLDSRFESYTDQRSGERMYNDHTASFSNKRLEEAKTAFEIEDEDIEEFTYSLL